MSDIVEPTMEVDDYMLLHPIIGFISVSMTWTRAMLLQREWDVDPGRLHVDKLWDQMMLWRDRGEHFFTFDSSCQHDHSIYMY